MEVSISALAKVLSRQVRHVGIVTPFTPGVDGIPASMAAEVAVKCRADVVKLMKNGDELVVEILIKEARQTKAHDVKVFGDTKEIALNLKSDTALLLCQLPVWKSKGSDARLEAVSAAVSGQSDAEQNPRNIYVLQTGTALNHIRT
jgi:hypothetical protein